MGAYEEQTGVTADPLSQLQWDQTSSDRIPAIPWINNFLPFSMTTIMSNKEKNDLYLDSLFPRADICRERFLFLLWAITCRNRLRIFASQTIGCALLRIVLQRLVPVLEQNFIQEWKLSHYVLTPMLMESPVKSPQTISGASQESGVVAFS